MVQQATLTFLKQLEKNNNKPWFDEHRKEYEEAKRDFEVLVQEILTGLTTLEPAFGEQKPKDCIFRIYRDVRFSKDKTPYKSHFGAFFSKGGKKYPGAGYYIHLEPGKTFAGGGLWAPETSLLKSVRQEIDYNFDEFKKLINDKSFKKYFSEINGEQVKTLPQGYTADNPAIEYLKMKSFTVSCKINDNEAANKAFAKQCNAVFTAMHPFIEYLNRPLD